MGRGAKALAVALSAIVIVAALFAYSYSQITTSVAAVSLKGVTLEAPGIGTLAALVTGNLLGVGLSLLRSFLLQIDLEVGNGGILPVSIPKVEFEYSINGIPVGSGDTATSYFINPKELITIPVQVEVPVSAVQALLPSIISRLGEIDVAVDGRAKVNLLFLNFDIPFKSEKHVSIAQEIKTKVSSLASRLGGGEGDIPSDFQILSIKWTAEGSTRTSVREGEVVGAIVNIQANSRFGYTITICVRQDRIALPDEEVACRDYKLVMQSGERAGLQLDFVAESGLTVRGYFVVLHWPGKQWQMPADYPPRLSIEKISIQTVTVQTTTATQTITSPIQTTTTTATQTITSTAG